MKSALLSVHKRKTAFTLIEMMIVIGIIALLAALTLGISSSVLRNSEISRTKNVMKLLEMTLQEWEQDQGRLMTYCDYTYRNNDGSYDGTFDVYPDDSIDGVVWGGGSLDNESMQIAMAARIAAFTNVIEYSETAKDVLTKISSDHLERVDQDIFAIDAWGNSIGIVFPGRAYIGTPAWEDENDIPEDQSGDLTIRDQAEDGLGSCINLRPYFVSAGPDGLWGYRYQANGGPDSPDQKEQWEATLDNVYSYAPFIVEKAR